MRIYVKSKLLPPPRPVYSSVVLPGKSGLPALPAALQTSYGRRSAMYGIARPPTPTELIWAAKQSSSVYMALDVMLADRAWVYGLITGLRHNVYAHLSVFTQTLVVKNLWWKILICGNGHLNSGNDNFDRAEQEDWHMIGNCHGSLVTWPPLPANERAEPEVKRVITRQLFPAHLDIIAAQPCNCTTMYDDC